MPLPDVDCTDCSASCTSLYEVVGSVVAVAYEAVASQLDPATCDEFVGFVSHAEPNHPGSDYVAGWIASVRPRDRNQSTSSGLMFPLPQVEVAIKLSESGYPTIGGDGAPTFEAMTKAAMHSYSHAEAMMRKIFSSVGRGSQNTILRDCGWQGMSALIPSRPSGGIVAWQFSVSLIAPGW
ncbi:MAG: hypothetical protein K0R44_39 [Thermomicrobiales bacterium]|jgi:hypothetical protein|nr:hypothetical protein [Thermomicrobiales bacterium]MDF3014814.1 hypothetical protein [Thermomicrobiales bacterium]